MGMKLPNLVKVLKLLSEEGQRFSIKDIADFKELCRKLIENEKTDSVQKEVLSKARRAFNQIEREIILIQEKIDAHPIY